METARDIARKGLHLGARPAKPQRDRGFENSKTEAQMKRGKVFATTRWPRGSSATILMRNRRARQWAAARSFEGPTHKDTVE
jgi:hypothetical protein